MEEIAGEVESKARLDGKVRTSEWLKRTGGTYVLGGGKHGKKSTVSRDW